MQKREKPVLTVKDVAAYLQVNQTTIYRLLRRAEIPAFKLGGDWRFNLESIDAWRQDAEARSPGRRRGKQSSGEASLESLGRLGQTIIQMLGPIAEMHAMLPIIKRIAEAIEDRRDASEEIARLYEGQALALRSHWDQLFELAPIAFAIIDRDCRAVSFNEAYCSLVKMSPKQLRAAVLTDLVCEDDRDRAVTHRRQLLTGEARSNTFVGIFTSKDVATMVRSRAWGVRENPAAVAEYAASLLERVATKDEASEMFSRCAEDLSQRRDKLLAPAR
jgi:excisionase family DNA binding protein/PAS domain S-box-containing protein